MTPTNIPPSIASHHWDDWKPRDVATICFVIEDDKILLIRKKRGLGAGKINGPGGRVDPGETICEGALREVREELVIEALEPEVRGVLRFQFMDGYSLLVFLFTASGHRGTPTETEEAIPLWRPVADVPFDEMWEDDELWFPLLLERRPFLGRFFFDGDSLGEYVLEECSTERLDVEIERAEIYLDHRSNPSDI